MGESTNPTPDKTRYLGRWTKTLPERFWEKVAPAGPDECWLWTASLNDGGYGQFALDGRPHRAHRIAYELMIGPIPDGLHIDHLCRVRRCVNPYHLDPVTNEVNTARGLLRKSPPKAKPECRNGHPFTDDNVRVDPEGWRRCRTCERVQSLASYYRRKARAELA